MTKHQVVYKRMYHETIKDQTQKVIRNRTALDVNTYTPLKQTTGNMIYDVCSWNIIEYHVGSLVCSVTSNDLSNKSTNIYFESRHCRNVIVKSHKLSEAINRFIVYHDCLHVCVIILSMHFVLTTLPYLPPLQEGSVEQKLELSEEEVRFEGACQQLASEAVRRGCADNVTVILVSVGFWTVIITTQSHSSSLVRLVIVLSIFQ